jgi:hypothetical protein
VSTKEKKSEDAEFEEQRKAIIAEALQAKEEGKPINFGGQKQVSIFHSYIFTQIAMFEFKEMLLYNTFKFYLWQ